MTASINDGHRICAFSPGSLCPRMSAHFMHLRFDVKRKYRVIHIIHIIPGNLPLAPSIPDAIGARLIQPFSCRIPLGCISIQSSARRVLACPRWLHESHVRRHGCARCRPVHPCLAQVIPRRSRLQGFDAWNAYPSNIVYP